MQNRINSFIESVVNVIIGFLINFIANIYILPLFGFNITINQSIQIGLIFTLISIIRSYLIRRWFNKVIIKLFNHQ
jgi:hypothetical protein